MKNFKHADGTIQDNLTMEEVGELLGNVDKYFIDDQDSLRRKINYHDWDALVKRVCQLEIIQSSNQKAIKND